MSLLDTLMGAEYGAPETATLVDGATYRCKIEIDEDTNVMDDGYWYGAMVWVDTNRETGYASPRPSGYDGRARKLQAPGGSAIWWQPPTDLTAEQIGAMATTITDLLEYGFIGIIVEKLDGVDAYGRPIVVASESLWGIESMVSDTHKREVIATLVNEVS